MNHDLLRDDEANRARALELASFIVEAPAGAGKTELLTQRFLRLLATVEEPEEIVALTFTNKAAGEMRHRIQESLDLARGGVPPAAPHKRVTYELARAALARAAARDWQLDAQPGRLRLTTIDALCASLARQMPFLSRFGAQPALAEDAGRHYLDAARRALDHLEGEDQHAAAVAVALAYLDNDLPRLAGLLADMLARREQWRDIADIEHPESAVGAALAALVTEELAAIAAELSPRWQALLMPCARFASYNLGGGPLLDWNAPLAASEGALPQWRALADLLLTQKDELRKTVTVKNGFPADKESKPQKEKFLEILAGIDAAQLTALQRIRQLPQANHEHDDVVRALARLAKLAAAELWLVFREHGEVDFIELAARAIAALGDEADPSELGLRLDYRIRHLLVDEFQDTSPTQIELLQRLTAGWQPDDGRTLFLVGDPMQSIYRFRKADVGLFLHVAERGIGALALESLRLSRNNRSCPEVVAWINARFPEVFPPVDEPVRGEIRYREFVATRESLPAAGVTLHPVVLARSEGSEAARIIDIIAAEWAVDPARTIAVLVRAKDHLTPLVAAIRRHPAGWRFSAVDIEALAGRQAVQDLIALTRALHHRADRVHWLAVLRAPWCGLTLADLHALAGDAHQATIWSLLADDERLARLSADGRQRAEHVRTVLGEALAGQGRQRRRPWVEDAWRKLGGPLCLAGAAERADADAFFARLDALDASGRFALDTLADEMSALFAAPDPLADGRLQLMSIHKSKGLEFDTVILPGLHREPAGRDAPLLLWESFPLADGEQLVVAPLNRRGATTDSPSAYDFLQRIERERSRNEEARVLYVAATRAVRRLHLVGVSWRDEAGQPLAARGGSALGRLGPAVTAEFDVAPLAVAQNRDDARGALADFVPRLLRLPQVAVDAWSPPPPAAAAPTAREETVDAFAAAVGTLTHACLEQIAAAPEDWDAARVTAMQPGYERWLGARGWPAATAKRGAAQVAALLERTLASADGRWVLQRHSDGGAEIALAAALDDGIVTRVVDRSFVADGVRWIIDYKTAAIHAAADVAMLRRHAERYRAQLEGYAALFAGEGLPQRLAVFYVAHACLVIVQSPE